MAFRKVVAGLVKNDINIFVGEKGNIFFDVDTGEFRLSDGSTPGGVPLGTGGGGGSYTLLPATTSRLGGVKVDGVTVFVTANGTISAAPAYNLPTASDVLKGGIKVGRGLEIAIDGTLSTNAGTAIYKITEIPDVVSTSLTNGDLLVYNSTTQKWVTSNNLNELNVDNLNLNGNTLSSTNVNGNITLDPSGSGYVEVSGTNFLVIPSGNTVDRGTGTNGAVRLNTQNSQFEGFANGNWASLGGVRSVDSKTYILAETSPGAGDNTLHFYANNIEVATLATAGLDIKSKRITNLTDPVDPQDAVTKKYVQDTTPTKLSQFINDAGFSSSTAVSTVKTFNIIGDFSNYLQGKARFYPVVQDIIRSVRISVSEISYSDLIVGFYRNGSIIQFFTVPSGSYVSSYRNLLINIYSTEYYTVNVESGAGRNLAFTLYNADL